jgi:predicted metal-dependent hydrolase
MRERGILLSIDGPYHNVIKIKPPMTFNRDNVDTVCYELNNIFIEFTESKFKVSIPKSLDSQEELKQAFEHFFREKAFEKITPRIKKWSKRTGLLFNEVKIRKLDKRWGSCTPSNNISINIDAIRLPFSLIDYLIVHELVHTKIKNHSKEFWAELSKHISNWKELDDKMYGMKF